MGARIISLLAVLVLVTACSSTAKDTDSVTTDGSLGMSERAPITDMEATMQEPTGPAAGTQQDFVINVGDRVFFELGLRALEPCGEVLLRADLAVDVPGADEDRYGLDAVRGGRPPLARAAHAAAAQQAVDGRLLRVL